ncbi:MAG: Ldh family oxidoreductase [Brevinema sp.]
MADKIISYQELVQKTSDKLTQGGLPRNDADIVAEILAHGDARGVRSHGTIRLEHYLNRIKYGGINLNADYQFKLTSKSCAIMDVDGGMGHVGMKKATIEALNRVKETGIFAVSVQNASHCGALSYYIEMAVKEGMIAMVFVNTDKCVVPFGAEKPYFGTNPIAFGFPGKKYRIIIDMATSEVAFGKVLAAREGGVEKIPSTWGVDTQGLPTIDPFKVVAVSPMAGYKGTAIATMVEGFTGFFTGAFGPHITSMYGDLDKYRNVGGFLFFMDPNAFGAADIYLQSTDKLFEEIKNAVPAPGNAPLVVAGEPEELRYQESLKNGVLIYESVYQILHS